VRSSGGRGLDEMVVEGKFLFTGASGNMNP
jgi:hypothetical protein